MSVPVVHTYRAAEPGLCVNSYLVEGESSVVVIDTNLLASDIDALRARLKALKKPLAAIFVTHAHPDHYNGVRALVRDAEVPVYAAGTVGRVIADIDDAKRAQWSPVYGKEWPAETYYPNSLLTDREQVKLDEFVFTVRELGPGESHADSYFVLTADGSVHRRCRVQWYSCVHRRRPLRCLARNAGRAGRRAGRCPRALPGPR
jgi:glyoxylase-like metal-dependent hydrolase (beta-lactamase superfamily II)